MRGRLARSLKSEDVDFPDRELCVRVRELTGVQRDQIIAEFYDRSENGMKAKPDAAQRLMPRLVAMCALDEEGEPLFGPDELDAVLNISAAVIDRLGGRVLQISGLSVGVEEQAGN